MELENNQGTVPLDPSLKNVLQQGSLKWIFVGGKGGVGKTTCSCSLAVQLSYVRPSVLILSTDPAHNLSDAFDQKFSSSPTLVKGFPNLYAMEIDPRNNQSDDSDFEEDDNLSTSNTHLMKEISNSIPGIDEALNYAAILKLVKKKNYSVVIFDTAPTGHTLRLLSFPNALEKCLEKMLNLRRGLMPLLAQMCTIFGLLPDLLTNKWEEILEAIKILNQQFTDPTMTTFVCVCTANFMSLYENERLIQELVSSNIDTHNIIVNQLHLVQSENSCTLCSGLLKIEAKYLDQIKDLYQDDFHLIQLPLLEKEVRGVEEIENFSKLLLNESNNSSRNNI